jgi:hypothetical protein
LIQNAEDNNYKTAADEGTVPSLSFTVTNTQIKIESNEDGFTERNVRAICSIGESTKTDVQGYIGEKGIGFKSVFKVASKVHVQSQEFSFSFNYDRKQKHGGLGMVTPLVEASARLSHGIRTQITLRLKDGYDRNRLFEKFESLPDTLLLFLRQLRKLNFKIGRSDNMIETDYELTTEEFWSHIRKTVNGKSTNLHYWVARETVDDMPEDEARKGTKESGPIKTAPLVLAFPLDDDDKPIIDDQYVFAFLPVKRMGFKVSLLCLI